MRREDAGVGELRDLIGWVRQRLSGEHTVRASVLHIEPAGPDSHLILFGEAQTSLSFDPPRLKARLDAAEFALIRAEHGEAFDPASLINRIVTVTLRTGLRQRFGRGASVQAKILRLLCIGQISVEAELDRELTLQQLRLDGHRFGPGTWIEPEDLYAIALIVSEHGDARHDVEHVLRPLEEAGFVRVHRVWASFEGAGAERSLAEAFAKVACLHRDHSLSVTLVCRGGGPVESFRALNTFGTAQAAVADAVPNLITGLGHASTPRTALDSVAARSEPTPTAAAMLVRQLVKRTITRAEHALNALEAAIEEELVAGGRIALARTTAMFDLTLRDLADQAERELRQLDRAVERSLLGTLSAAADEAATPLHVSDGVAVADLGTGGEDISLTESLALVIAAESGRIITTVKEARAKEDLYIQFPDGAVLARIESFSTTSH